MLLGLQSVLAPLGYPFFGLLSLNPLVVVWLDAAAAEQRRPSDDFLCRSPGHGRSGLKRLVDAVRNGSGHRNWLKSTRAVAQG